MKKLNIVVSAFFKNQPIFFYLKIPAVIALAIFFSQCNGELPLKPTFTALPPTVEEGGRIHFTNTTPVNEYRSDYSTNPLYHEWIFVGGTPDKFKGISPPAEGILYSAPGTYRNNEGQRLI
jgi:hypothetical protein